ncbi:MAG TPA: TetR/AcrR family transcriptional regulator [Vicinamibacteria bacterium]
MQQALELFSRKGYEATSVREICEAADITKPTLYHFYGSKEGVYRAIVDGTLDAFRSTMVAAVESPGSPAERLKRVARLHLARARENDQLFRFILALIHNPASSAPRTDFPRFYEGMVALVAKVVEEGVRTGQFAPGPLEVRMLVFMGALSEAMCSWLITGRPDLKESLADQLVDAVIGGWRAPVVH